MSHPRAIGAIALFILAATSAVARAQSPQERLWDAAISGDTTALSSALQAGARIDSLDTRSSVNGRRALNWAAYNDRAAAVRFLLGHGADIEARNRTWNTPLHHAAEAGAIASVRVLLAAGADPTAVNFDGNKPSDVARRNGRVEVATLLEQAERGVRPVQ